MVFEQSHPIQAASLQPLKKRQKELSLRKTTPLMRSKPHFIEKAPNQAASTTAQNLTISVPDGVKYVKGPLLKIWERFILLTESKRQIFGVRTFDAHASAYSTMSLLKVIKFCEHFGFLDQNLVTPGEVATLFAQCTKIHSSFDRLMKQFHCDEFLAQKRMVNCEIQIQDFLNFMVRLAVLIFSRPPFEQDNELTVAEKVKAFISHFRFDDCAHIRKVLDEAKGEDHMNRRKGTSLKKQNGIMNSVRSNFGGLNESENRYMDSLEISDMELLPLMEILVLEKPRYRELESTSVDARGLKIGTSYRYKFSVCNDESCMKKFKISTRDSHVISINETDFILASGMSKSFFVALTPIGHGCLTLQINDTMITILISV